MIQRIQSVYLFIAAIFSVGVLFLVPIFTKADSSLLMATHYPVFLTLYIISAGLSVLSVFRFKKRQLQVVLGRLNIIINFILFGIILYTYFEAIKPNEGSLGLASFIPIVVVIFLTLANKSIIADETLVRAADRIR